MITEPEISLFHKANVAMEQQGIMNRDFPSTLPLYLSAMRFHSCIILGWQQTAFDDQTQVQTISPSPLTLAME